MPIPFMFFGAHSWRGESGRRYMFRSVLTKGGIPDTGGCYVFVKRNWAFFLEALYVGKAANLRSRLLGHEKWGKAWWILGATEQHVICIPTEEERRVTEEDLIRGLKPPMNDVMVPRNEDDEPTLPENRKKWEDKRFGFWAKLFGGGKISPQAESAWIKQHDHYKPNQHEAGYYDPSKHKKHEFDRKRA